MGKLIPQRETLVNPHILVYQDRYEIVSTGKVVTTDQYGNPLSGNALAQALRFHGFPGVVVLTHGNQYKGLQLNGGNPNGTRSVIWENGNVRDITILGGEPGKAASILGVGLFDGMGDLRIENATLMNAGVSKAPLLVNMNGIVGKIKLYDLKFLPEDPKAWFGKGMKWNFRGHGVAGWDCRNLQFHKALEHGGYVDNHQGDSYFINCRGSEMGRTLLQITNRAESGPSAYGDLVIKGCEARDNEGDGGSDYTIVGNGDGTIWFMNNTSYGNANGSQGAFVHWTDHGHGAYLTESGHSSQRLIMMNFVTKHSNADRDHVAIAGVKDVIIAGWDITGNRTAMHFNSQFGGGIDNGSVGLYTWNRGKPSEWSGWRTSIKVKKAGQILSDQDINKLEYLRR